MNEQQFSEWLGPSGPGSVRLGLREEQERVLCGVSTGLSQNCSRKADRKAAGGGQFQCPAKSLLSPSIKISTWEVRLWALGSIACIKEKVTEPGIHRPLGHLLGLGTDGARPKSPPEA